jgi:fluoride exporter
MTAVLIGVAGAAGALARYQVGLAAGDRSFPWATLGINLVGSFLLGLLVEVAGERGWPDTTTLPLGIGFLGAFTTFSTFSVETQTMLRDGRTAAAATYVAASLVGGVLAAALGYATARAIT